MAETQGAEIDYEPLRRSFKLMTAGEVPELDRLAMLVAIMNECQTQSELNRVLDYLTSAFGPTPNGGSRNGE